MTRGGLSKEKGRCRAATAATSGFPVSSMPGAKMVFKAWSSADDVKRWFSPETFTVSAAKVQMRSAACSRLHALACGRGALVPRHVR